MAEAARAPPELPEEILHDILLRLPPKPVLRCRAVCKAWRRLASDRGFLLAHHRRQPSQPLLAVVRDSKYHPEVGDFCVYALDLRSHEFRPVARFSGYGNLPIMRESRLAVYGSCNGALLLSSDDHLYLCNPTTRHWAPLPPLHLNNTIAGLYAHRPSEEYRVIYFRRREDNICNYVMAVGSGEERLVRPPNVSMRPARYAPPILLHDNLHWPPFPSRPDYIQVFDTVAEKFHGMRAPALHSNVKLLDMDGELGMSSSCGGTSDLCPSRVDLWLLQDYKVWVCKHRIELPVVEISRFLGFFDLYDAAVVSREGDVLLDPVHWVLHYDMEGNLVANLRCDYSLLQITPHMLKESLVPHALLRMKNPGAHEPPFFRGL